MNKLITTPFVKISALLTILLFSAALIPSLHAEKSIDLQDVPVNEISSEGFIRNWLILGAFDGQRLEVEDIKTPGRTAFNTDYLTSLGGEANAIINSGVVVVISRDDKPVEYRPSFLSAGNNGKVNFHKLYDPHGLQAAYAFCYLNSGKDQTVDAYLGSDDSAKVWINHEQVHAMWTPGRGTRRWDDHFKMKLKEGINPVLIKIEDNIGGWDFVFEVYRAEDHNAAINSILSGLKINMEKAVINLEDDLELIVDTIPALPHSPQQININLQATNESRNLEVPAFSGKPVIINENSKKPGIYILQVSLNNKPEISEKYYLYRGDFNAAVETDKAKLTQWLAGHKANEDTGKWDIIHKGIADYAKDFLNSLEQPISPKTLIDWIRIHDFTSAISSIGKFCQTNLGRQFPMQFNSDFVFDPPYSNEYLLYLPKEMGEDGQKLPLIIFLHGSGERGKHVWDVAINELPLLLEQDPDYPFIVASPQCPDGTWWQVGYLESLLKDLKNRLPVDEDRIILTGLSMGGFGSWEWAMQNPDHFAALSPVCGGGNPTLSPRLESIPVWVFHGEDDPVVPVYLSDVMVGALKKTGCNVRYTVYPGVGHNSWVKAYREPELVNWMLQARRRQSQAKTNKQDDRRQGSGERSIVCLPEKKYFIKETFKSKETLFETVLQAQNEMFINIRTEYGLPAFEHCLIQGNFFSSDSKTFNVLYPLPETMLETSRTNLSVTELKESYFLKVPFRGGFDGLKEAVAQIESDADLQQLPIDRQAMRFELILFRWPNEDIIVDILFPLKDYQGSEKTISSSPN